MCDQHLLGSSGAVRLCVQVFKRIVKYRSTRHPELVAVNHWLAMEALARCRRENPGVSKLYDELHVGRNMAAGALYDDTAGTEWFSGRLEPATNNADAVRTHAS